MRPFNSRPPSGGGGFSRGPRKFNKRDDGGLRINEEISAPQIRLIDEEGKMLGVMPPREALAIAQGRGLDLIEIAPTASPPTCKIMDYGKYKYENKKKDKAAKKKQTVITIKEIQVRPRTDQHDLDVKLRAARRFLLEGDKVKVNLRFSGREMAHQEFGVEVLKKFMEALKDVAAIEVAPKSEGRQMFVLMAPDAAKVKDYLKANPNAMSGPTPESEESEGPEAPDEA